MGARDFARLEIETDFEWIIHMYIYIITALSFLTLYTPKFSEET